MVAAGTGFSQRCLPDFRSSARTESLPSLNAVRKIESSHTHGEEGPDGTLTCQSSFEPGPKCTGGLALSEMPPPFGPRNCGQLAAARPESAITRALALSTVSMIRFII